MICMCVNTSVGTAVIAVNGLGEVPAQAALEVWQSLRIRGILHLVT